ncbi:unnamed protein product [Natator depressus]
MAELGPGGRGKPDPPHHSPAPLASDQGRPAPPALTPPKSPTAALPARASARARPHGALHCTAGGQDSWVLSPALPLAFCVMLGRITWLTLCKAGLRRLPCGPGCSGILPVGQSTDFWPWGGSAACSFNTLTRFL